MATSYPGAVDAFTNPAGTDYQNSATVPHASQHANANDAIEAIETELGVNPSGAAATVVARFGAIEAAGWVTSARIADGTIVNADINAAAAIDQSKVSNLTTDLAGKAATVHTHAPADVTGTAVVTSDARLSDARTPTAHAASHESGGADELDLGSLAGALAVAQVTGAAPLASPTFTGTVTIPNVNLAAWTTFTPSWTNVTLGTGVTNSGRYCTIGKTTFFLIKLILGTGGAASGRLSVALPVTQSGFMTGVLMDGECRDASASITYALQPSISAGSLYVDPVNSAGTYAVKALSSATVPFTWAVSDEIYLSGAYEIA